MIRNNINGLSAFLAVGRERSFTRAAAKIGISQSALSHTIKNLEKRLGVRLLTRTTRAVSPTEAGEKLLKGIGPHFEEIEAQLDGLNAFRDKLSGTIRINAPDYAISCVIWPRLQGFLLSYPDIKIELMLDDGLSNIVAERYDVGVRMGEQLAKDMISARISADFRFAVVGSPSYFSQNGQPRSPHELITYNCINYRFPTSGTLYAWEFKDNNREVKVRVDGQLTFNNIFHVLDAAIAGHGLAYVPEEIALPYIEKGELVRVLEKWSPYWDGFYLYYPNRHHASPAFRVLTEALRHR